MSEAQRAWLMALEAAGAEVYVARPADLGALAWLLRRPDRPDPAEGEITALARATCRAIGQPILAEAA